MTSLNSRVDIMSIISGHKRSYLAVAASVAIIASAPGIASAEELAECANSMSVSIAPSPIVVDRTPTESDPWLELLTVRIDLGQGVSSYRSLEVGFDDTLVWEGTDTNSSNNVCNTKTGGLTGSTCSIVPEDLNATPPIEENEVIDIKFTATLDRIGEYFLEVKSTKSGGGRDGEPGVEEEACVLVEFEMTVVELKAPPAIANEYIKDEYKRLTGGRRGCVISHIAELHGKHEYFGYKPGPYDVNAVHAKVEELLDGVCRR